MTDSSSSFLIKRLVNEKLANFVNVLSYTDVNKAKYSNKLATPNTQVRELVWTKLFNRETELVRQRRPQGRVPGATEPPFRVNGEN